LFWVKPSWEIDQPKTWDLFDGVIFGLIRHEGPPQNYMFIIFQDPHPLNLGFARGAGKLQLTINGAGVANCKLQCFSPQKN
jgi:hypothetical protein